MNAQFRIWHKNRFNQWPDDASEWWKFSVMPFLRQAFEAGYNAKHNS